MLGHVGSRGTLVADQLLVGGTVEVAVLAGGEADGILLGGQLGLSAGAAEEHEQLKDRGKALVVPPVPNSFWCASPGQGHRGSRTTREVLSSQG